MKRAVGHLIPFIEEEKRLSGSTADDNAGVIIMATVKASLAGWAAGHVLLWPRLREAQDPAAVLPLSLCLVVPSLPAG